MACMEHICTQCDWTDFGNTRGTGLCPKCGAPVNSFFDEVPDRDDDFFRERDDEEDDE